MQKIIAFITLFSSSSTLVCCALPALMVAIGAGSTLAAMITYIPALIWLSVYKIPIFIFAGIMLTVSGIMQYYNKNQACPIDSSQNQACSTSKKISKYVYILSLTIYLISGFMIFIAPILI